MCSRLRAQEREIKKEREKVSAFLEREKRERGEGENVEICEEREKEEVPNSLSLSPCSTSKPASVTGLSAEIRISIGRALCLVLGPIVVSCCEGFSFFVF